MSVSPAELDRKTRAMMKKGSKSFSLAALLFDRRALRGAQLLYAWCRWCDDEIDNESNPQRARAKLSRLREMTAQAFDQQTPSAHLPMAFQALRVLARDYGVEESYANDLLEGLATDVEGAHVRDDDDLALYCYRVAGVVGLMMTKIMGVSDPRAFQHAKDLGQAMQMTNIARDVREDFHRKRIYIPDTWFMSVKPLLRDQFRPAAFTIQADRLVQEAEDFYRSGEEGLKYLPFRAALAVGGALVIYREIGRRVAWRGQQAWTTRTVIPLSRKIVLMTAMLARITAQRFGRRSLNPATP